MKNFKIVNSVSFLHQSTLFIAPTKCTVFIKTNTGGESATRLVFKTRIVFCLYLNMLDMKFIFRIVFFWGGNFPASELLVPTFRNFLSVPSS